jgi:prepilin-type N-terminal cleavage/methylation domain-containing protein
MTTRTQQRLHQVKTTNQAEGFTLIEVMVALAVIGLVATIGIMALDNIQENSKMAKFEQDVHTINSAVSAYLVSGGSLATSTTCAEVIAKLKTRASAVQSQEISGLKGQMVDSRLSGIMQTASEAATSEWRAVWVPAKNKFQIRTTGAAGVKEFALNMPVAAAIEETRVVPMKLATEDDWIWDYTDPAATREAFTEEAVVSVTETPPTASPHSYQALAPPIFSVGGGTYPLISYDFPLSLIDPNPDGTAEIYVSVDGGSMQLYTGSISVPPGSAISSFAKSIHPDLYLDSGAIDNSYQTTPVQLDVACSVPAASVTYQDVGGAIIGGRGVLGPGSITLENGAAIPAQYQNSGVFTVHWTYDGSNPLTSGTRNDGYAFSGGFSGQEFTYGLAAWGAASSLQINVAAASLNTNLVTDSSVDSLTLGISPMPLRTSVFLADLAGEMVGIAGEEQYGDMPAGYQIYYTTDGTDPGDDGLGKPVAGTPCTAEISFPTEMCFSRELKARVYGPLGYEHWFTPSPVGNLIKPSLASTSDEYAFICDFKDSQLCNFTWLMLGSAQFTGTADQLDGSIALVSGVDLLLNRAGAAPADFTLDPAATLSGNGSQGATPVIEDLSQYAAAAEALNLTAGNLPFTQNFGKLQSSTVITSTFPDGGINVIRIKQVALNNANSNLTIQGTANDYFIINIEQGMRISGTDGLIIDGLDPSHVLLNFLPGADFDLGGNAWVLGATILAPNSDISISGGATLTGSLISGETSNKISMISGSGSIHNSTAFGGCDDCCGGG